MDQKVSVILPTYNRAGLIGRAVESVLQQTYRAFELLIVDDGSTDNTKEIVLSYDDPRIRYLPLTNNGGPASARNAGMMQARYPYLAFHDSDDVWRAGKLEKQMQVLQQSGSKTGLVYGIYEYNGLEGQKAYFPRKEIPAAEKQGFLYPRLLTENLIGMPTVLMKRECIETAGGMAEGLKCLEDYEWLLRISKLFEIAFVDDVVVDVYATKGGVNQNLNENLSARCMIIGKYKEDMARYQVLDQVVHEFLEEAAYLNCLDQVAEALSRVLSL